MSRKTRNWGRGNISEARDVIFQMFLSNPSDIFKEFFELADQRFRAEVSESGQIYRISKSMDYSSESLFTSLMQIGLPLDVAVQIPLHILAILKDIADEKPKDQLLSTADVRVAVVRGLELLEESGRFSPETVEMWRAAYIRRYGNPDNQFVKVVDRAAYSDLNFDYITRELLPHLLCRILGHPRESNPAKVYGHLFTKARLGEMAKEIIHIVNTLNVYSISYRALLHLLQDIILEPPHPWMVSEDTISRATDYNVERMQSHMVKLRSPVPTHASASLSHSYQEFFRHASAAVLARYGAFLGVGSRYGLTELIRILGLRGSNPTLWSFCRIKSIDADLRVLGTSTADFDRTARRVRATFTAPAPDGAHLAGLLTAVEYFDSIVCGLQDVDHASGEA